MEDPAFEPVAPGPVFQAANQHPERAGPPPAIDAADFRYTGFYEGPLGEQWVFTFDGRRALLRGGSIDWDHPVEVVDAIPRGVVIDAPEQAWLVACWYAATEALPGWWPTGEEQFRLAAMFALHPERRDAVREAVDRAYRQALADELEELRGADPAG